MAEVTKEIDRLLQDREKYSTFIKRLESERASSSERAYSKVRADYEKRLEDVVRNLHAHSDALRSKLSEMENSLRSLEEERSARNEQLDEARLRRSVGEYRDDSEWSGLERQLLDSVQSADAQLEETRTQIVRLNGIIAQVEGEPPAETPAPPPPQAAPAPRPAPSPPPAAPQPGPPPAAAAPTGGDDFVSLGDLVMEEGGLGDDFEPVKVNSPAAPPQTPKEPAKEPASEPPTGGAVGDELAFLESLSLGNESSEGEAFSFLDEHGRGTAQTIICPHCSAANDPAEWYCTECGEELPAE